MSIFRLLFLALFLSPTLAMAAGEVLNFTTATATGDVSVTPSFTWNTVPAAASCNAVGPTNWAGAKAPAGTQALPAINISTDYTLACTWPADSLATLSWVNPTLNTNGSAYTNPQDTVIKYGPSPQTFTNSPPPCTAPVVCLVVADPTSTMRTITGFTSTAVIDFAVFARSTASVMSDPSMKASKTFSGTPLTVTRTITITVNPKPSPVTGVSVQ